MPSHVLRVAVLMAVNAAEDGVVVRIRMTFNAETPSARVPSGVDWEVQTIVIPVGTPVGSSDPARAQSLALGTSLQGYRRRYVARQTDRE